MQFSNDWFKYNVDEWARILSPLKDKQINYLEIGSYEGQSLCWVLQNLFNHAGSRAVVVDTFSGGIEAEDIDFEEVERRWDANVAETGKSLQTTKFKVTSQAVLPHLLNPMGAKFDLIYIDGSHIGEDVLFDLILSWKMLSPGGIMILDDYKFDYYKDERLLPRRAIDGFLSTMEGSYDVLHKDWQVIIQRKFDPQIDMSLNEEGEVFANP